MTKNYKKIISKINKKFIKRLEVINKIKEDQEITKHMVKRMMTTDPRQRLIDEVAEQYREEVREKDK